MVNNPGRHHVNTEIPGIFNPACFAVLKVNCIMNNPLRIYMVISDADGKFMLKFRDIQSYIIFLLNTLTVSFIMKDLIFFHDIFSKMCGVGSVSATSK